MRFIRATKLPRKRLQRKAEVKRAPSAIDIKTFPLPDPKLGTHIPIDRFLVLCGIGVITNSSGSAYYATENERTNLKINPAEVIVKPYKINKNYKHAVWFSKITKSKRKK